MFQRHCVTVEFMKSHPEFDWIFFLDADIAVINPRHRIEEFIDPNRHFDLIFYDRMYNWEIMAGSYLAKNTMYARDFLKYWAEFQPPDSFHGTDNGAIHEVFMHKFASQNQTDNCDKIYFESKDYSDLFKYEACVRHSLGEDTRDFVDKSGEGKVKILGKSRAWVRDGSVMVTDKWATNDFMVHGWKNSTMDLSGLLTLGHFPSKARTNLSYKLAESQKNKRSKKIGNTNQS
uniref:Nucleotide-diphospho-sugar transferase domain-containing protein n=1 Tax=Ditylenchus dipsaci TaxID=166011 RepID=A0A915ER70_9BILA